MKATAAAAPSPTGQGPVCSMGAESGQCAGRGAVLGALPASRPPQASRVLPPAAASALEDKLPLERFRLNLKNSPYVFPDGKCSSGHI